jgi:hypothetical protein
VSYVGSLYSYALTHCNTHTNTSLLPHYTLFSDGDGKLLGEVGVRLPHEEYMQLQLNYSLPDGNPTPPKSLFFHYTSLTNFWTALSHMSLSKWAKGGEQGLYSWYFPVLADLLSFMTHFTGLLLITYPAVIVFFITS